MKDQAWRVLNRQTIIHHPFLAVDQETVMLPDGTIIPDWHRVYAGDYVNIVAVNENGEFLILDGYKHGIGRDSWQVVGGYIEAGEDPALAAQRELREEAALQAGRWLSLGTYIVDANRYVGSGHFYLARDLQAAEPLPSDDLERATIRWVTLAAVRQALADGTIAGMGYAMALSLSSLHLLA